jgi:hypothetical protein
MEKIPMRTIRDVLRHSCKLHLSIRQTARSTNTSRATVGDYRKRFEKSGIAIDTLLAMSDKEIEQALFGPARLPGKPKRPLPDMAEIHLQMQQCKRSKVTLTAISIERIIGIEHTKSISSLCLGYISRSCE